MFFFWFLPKIKLLTGIRDRPLALAYPKALGSIPTSIFSYLKKIERKRKYNLIFIFKKGTKNTKNIFWNQTAAKLATVAQSCEHT